jgi:hypothetical protein
MVVPRAVASWGLVAASLVALAASSGLRFLLRSAFTWKRSLNLGTGQGTTAGEWLATVRRVSGRNCRVEYGLRRNGDSPALVADNTTPCGEDLADSCTWRAPRGCHGNGSYGMSMPAFFSAGRLSLLDRVVVIRGGADD